MESRVQIVILYEGVTLDIKALMEYHGQGRCRELQCYNDTAGIYRKQLKTWATSRNWEVTNLHEKKFVLERSEFV